MSANGSVSHGVLVIEADEQQAQARVEQLRIDGFAARAVWSETAARALLAGAEAAVLGDVDGSLAPAIQVLRDLRAGRLTAVDPALPVVAVVRTEAECLSAYAAGADMALSRTASTAVLSATVRALMRLRSRTPTRVQIGRLEIDRSARSVTVDGAPLKISAREFDLLDTMAKAPGRLFTREELSREVWGNRYLDSGRSRSIDTHVSRLRGKLRDGGGNGSVALENVWGRGYKLTEGQGR